MVKETLKELPKALPKVMFIAYMFFYFIIILISLISYCFIYKILSTKVVKLDIYNLKLYNSLINLKEKNPR